MPGICRFMKWKFHSFTICCEKVAIVTKHEKLWNIWPWIIKALTILFSSSFIFCLRCCDVSWEHKNVERHQHNKNWKWKRQNFSFRFIDHPYCFIQFQPDNARMLPLSESEMSSITAISSNQSVGNCKINAITKKSARSENN